MSNPFEPPNPYSQPNYGSQVPGERDYLPAVLFSWLLGWLGVDRFYLGYIGLGIAKLVVFIISWFVCGVPIIIWWLIDAILITSWKVPDAQGRPLRR